MSYIRRAMRFRATMLMKRRVSSIISYFDMLIPDHGLIRCVYSNRAIVAPDVERSSHPTPLQVAAAAGRGIKTIVNLRGACINSSCLLSQKACEDYGIKLVRFKIVSRKLPTRKTIFAARDLFNSVEYPILMHCKSGADRVELMSALYLLVHAGLPVETARRRLSIRFGHVRRAKTGILDFFLESYQKANTEEKIDFLSWVKYRYDPVMLRKTFRSSRWADVLVTHLLRRE